MSSPPTSAPALDLEQHARHVASLAKLYSQPPPPSLGPLQPQLAELTSRLEQLCECVWRVAKGSEGKDVHYLTAAMNDFRQQLQSLSTFTHQLPLDLQVPLSFLQAVDASQSPDVVLKSLLEECSSLNDLVRGKMFATKAVKDRIHAFQQMHQCDET